MAKLRGLRDRRDLLDERGRFDRGESAQQHRAVFELLTIIVEQRNHRAPWTMIPKTPLDALRADALTGTSPGARLADMLYGDQPVSLGLNSRPEESVPRPEDLQFEQAVPIRTGSSPDPASKLCVVCKGAVTDQYFHA